MKQEKGLGIAGVIILVCVLIIAITGIILLMRNMIVGEKGNDVVSDMLQVQGACKVVSDNIYLGKKDESLVGTELGLYEDEIITEFKKLNIIPEDQYEKYYVLTDEDLQTLNLDIKNEENSYYIVNYEDDELIITKGYKGKYKLSEIEAEVQPQAEENNEEEQAQEEVKEESETQE